MTWLGYAIVITGEQKVWAMVAAILFAMYGRWCGRPWALCIYAAPVIYLLSCLYAINDNAMWQNKAEFCTRHHEASPCEHFNKNEQEPR